jgi:prefoldin subunit 5
MTKKTIVNIQTGAVTQVDLTTEEQSAYDAGISFDDAIAQLREKRDNLLKQTDYLALSDQTLSSDMTTYRQNLRDLTNSLDTVEKVNNVTWPTKP